MSVKTSGSLSLAEIAAEFGGGHPISLNSYYRGGSHVPSGTAAGTGSKTTTPLSATSPAQISTSSTIQISMFYGTSNQVFTYPAQGNTYSVAGSAVIGATANGNAQISLNNDGGIYGSSDSGAGLSGSPPVWLTWSGVSGTGAFEMLWSGNSDNFANVYDNGPGNAPVGGGTWHNMVNGVTFHIPAIDDSIPNAGNFANFAISIRDVATHTVRENFTLSITSGSYPHEGA